MEQVFKLILDSIPSGKIDQNIALQILKSLKQKELRAREDIAVIGIGLQFAGINDCESFWSSIVSGLDHIKGMPESRKKDISPYLTEFMGIKKESMSFLSGSFLEDIDKFDYKYFKLSPKEASLMEPSQRLFMQVALKAIEDAGYGGGRLQGSRMGIYLGLSANGNYQRMIYDADPSSLAISMTGNIAAMTPTRVSYLLDLKGPTLVMDTACSSSVVSVHTACNAINNGECEMALAGGIRINVLPFDSDDLKIGIESSDNRTRAFDDNADGAGIGEGVAVVMLKPLKKAEKDGDNIYAVIKGSAVNQDGSSAGITAPNPGAQSEVITRAWEDARINPETLAFIEAHGTGTNLGDPIEIEGIQRAFRQFTDKRQFCALGSVKTNVGHLYECAGMAGLIKVVLALKHRVVPPGINFQKPNRKVDFSNSPVYVNTKARKYDAVNQPMRGSVSAFGLSGTNCHMVLEEYKRPEELQKKESGEVTVLALSAASLSSLGNLLDKYLEWLDHNKCCDINDVCFTANTGRGHYGIRLALLVKDLDDLRRKLLIIKNSGFMNMNEPWMFYGEHRVILSNKEKNPEKDITEKEKALYTNEAQGHLSRIKETVFPSAAQLGMLCSLYVRGADVNWQDLLEGRGFKRVSLPGYSFDGYRCWLDFGNLSKDQEITGERDLFYRMEWRKAELGPVDSRIIGNILLIKDKEGFGSQLAEKLKKQGNKIIEADLSDSYRKEKDGKYFVRPVQEDFERLFEDLGEIKPRKIIHTASLDYDGVIESFKALEESQKRGPGCLFFLARAAIKAFKDHNVNLDMVTITRCAVEVSGKEAGINPHQNTASSIGKVIRKEHPYIGCRSIDIDSNTDVDSIITELSAVPEDYLAAYRNGVRYAEVFSRVDIENVPSEDILIKSEGVYVITGGLGGIGLKTAKHLASLNKVNLALISRSRMPDPGEWGKLLDENKDQDLVKRIKSIMELEETGASVACFSGDVAKPLDMEWVFTELRQRFGRINGIIHGAGVGKDEPVTDRSLKDYDEIFSPKVYGTWVLDYLTQNDRLDFFVMFSSVATLFSALGQTEYVAANSYLDSFADFRSRQGKKTLTINWSTWKETGMAARSVFTMDTIFKTMPDTTGIEGFKEVLGRGLKRVLIGELNYSEVGVNLLSRSLVRLSEELSSKVASFKENTPKRPRTSRTAAIASGDGVTLTGRENGDYNEVETRLAGICKKILGFDEIDVRDSFFELGADSIILMKIHGETEKLFDVKLKITDMFEHSNVMKLSEHMLKKGVDGKKQAASVKKDIKPCTESGEIAIIGMALRFPFADNMEEYWENVSNGVDCIRAFPEARRKDVERYLNLRGIPLEDIEYEEGAFLEDVDKFDHQFFRISPKEASLMDPSQRIFLETVWSAIEDGGYGGERIRGTDTGVYLGYSNNSSYYRMISEAEPSYESMAIVGNNTAVTTGRISYLLDLKGPSLAIDTACSSSLVAVHLACQAIKSGECEMAIAGGVRININPVLMKANKKGIGIESADGKTRAFDDYCDGTVYGEGVAAVLLKPLQRALEDKDNIYAVIKGNASNQDGRSIGLTAPNPCAQEDVIAKAWDIAGIEPETISYIEAHGTATRLGDPIEISGLESAFKRYTEKKHFCAVSSVKTNMGHLSEGAGIAGLIKAVLALKKARIPPHLNFNKPNRKVDFEALPVYINTKLKKWEKGGHPRRCGVSAFGVGGTNCHVILEESPQMESNSRTEDPVKILALSARNIQALKRLLADYLRYISVNEFLLEELCYTANTGRGHYSHRLAMAAKDAEDLRQKLIRLSQEDLESFDAGWYFYGVHKLNSAAKGSSTEEITEEEKLQLDNKARDSSREFIESGRRSEKALKELCSFYVKGAEIDFIGFYSDKKINKISIPTYPFERNRCWVEIPEIVADSTFDWDNIFYTTGWMPAGGRNLAESTPQGKILVLKDQKGIGDQLASHLEGMGAEVATAELGKEFTEISATRYIIENNEEDYKRLFERLKDVDLRRIVHLFSISGDTGPKALPDLEESLDRGVRSLFHIARAIQNSILRQEIDLVLVVENGYEVTGGEERINPENAALCGLGKAIRQEYPQLKTRCIDIDGFAEAGTIARELYAQEEMYHTAFRNGHKFIEEFRVTDVEGADRDDILIKEDGVYIITGGTGGIGLEVAKYLSLRNKAKIALINRRKLPERKLWEEILKSGYESKLCNIIENINDIESKGAEVVLFSADVADYDRMGSIVGGLREKYGRINGVIHAAGVAGDGFIARKDEQVFNRVLSSKIHGAWILDKQTEEDDLDFFILFSSVITLFSEPGQGDYTSANAYLDAFSHYRNKLGKNTKTIGWVAWKETGMAYDHGAHIDGGFKAISTAKAIEGFHEVMGRKIKRTVIGQFNRDYDHKIEENVPVMSIQSEINKAIEHMKKRLPGSISKNSKLIKEVALKGGEAGSCSDTEIKIAGIWGRNLGYGEIDINDNFFELGGDSVIALRIANEFYKEMNIPVTAVDMLVYPTIKGLMAHISKMGSSGGKDESSLYAPIPAVHQQEYYPVSAMQKRLMLIDRIEGRSTSYNISTASIIYGGFDVQKLKAVFAELVVRHEILRTSFDFVKGEPVQIVHKTAEPGLEMVDVQSGGIEETIYSLIKPFDLSKAPLMRLFLIRVSEDRHILLLDIHHMICDGSSMDIIMREITGLYAGRELPGHKVQYKDYAVWHGKYMLSDSIKKQEEYWLKALSGSLPVLNLPTDFERPMLKSSEGRWIVSYTGKELSGALNRLAAQTGSTLFMLAFAAYNVLLTKYTNQEDILIGMPVSGRSHPDTENILGMFINTLVMRSFPEKSKGFRGFLTEVREGCLAAYKNQDCQFDEIINKLDVRRDPSRNPLYDAIFVLQNVGREKAVIKDFNSDVFEFEPRKVPVDIMMELIENSEGIRINLYYCTELFREETAQRMVNDYIRVLTAVSEDPDVIIGDIELGTYDFEVSTETAEDVIFSF